MGVHTRCGTVPPWWSEHLCNGSPARIEACGDHHTLMLMQGGEVLACGSNINAEGQLRIGTRNSEWYPTALESRRDRFRRWRRGGGNRRRRACPGVTRHDASSCCCLARRRAGKDVACGDHHTLVLMQGGEVLWQGGARRDGQLTIALTIARYCARPRARARPARDGPGRCWRHVLRRC